MIYPLVIGLYAVGFFWDMPSDIIGFFDITQFIFKASTVYLTTVSVVLLTLLIATIFYGPLSSKAQREDKAAENSIEESDSSKTYTDTWSEMSKARKITVAFAGVGILALAGFVAWIDPPPFSSGPERFGTILGCVMIVGIITRPLLDPVDWKASAIIFGMTVMMLIPILVGHSDATYKDGDPKIKIGEGTCGLIFATEKTLIYRCPKHIVVKSTDSKLSLTWTLE